MSDAIYLEGIKRARKILEERVPYGDPICGPFHPRMVRRIREGKQRCPNCGKTGRNSHS